MSTFKRFASFVLAATSVPALPAEPHCPGNVASVPFHLTNSYQTIVAVSVNHFGPYNFLLDTGTQVTMVDPSLAAELDLNTQGSAEGSRSRISCIRSRRATRPARSRLPCRRQSKGTRV